MQQSSATPKIQDVGIGLQKIVACSHSSSQCLLVSTVFSTVSSLHTTSFLYLFHYFFYPGLALTLAPGEMITIARTRMYIIHSCFVRVKIKWRWSKRKSL